MDLSDCGVCGDLERAIAESRDEVFHATPILAVASDIRRPEEPIRNPANHSEVVGHAASATEADVQAALSAAATSTWGAAPAAERADILERGGDLLERSMDRLAAFLVREAGKTMPNAVSEVREAVDFCRYYAAQARLLTAEHKPLGSTVCISPWNFPLAIFAGQIAAALVAGNPVLAKPAEQTPLIAAEAVKLLHEAGVPRDALQLLPGLGSVGAALVADVRVQAVVFTGSTEVARSIQRALAERGNIPLIAETGGQNAMIVDSSALPEQVVGDVLASAFELGGTALLGAPRAVCPGGDRRPPARHAERRDGGTEDWRSGATLRPMSAQLSTAAALKALSSYLASSGHRILHQADLPEAPLEGTFIAPALLAIRSVSQLTHEVFGPVLHVLRFARRDLPRLIDDINATGHGLTLGVHSRIDETIATILERARAGNIYVNRNMIGAVVGVQPFGGEGLSGTGPKAGGPLYIRRLLREGPPIGPVSGSGEPKLESVDLLAEWVKAGAGGMLSKSEEEQLGEILSRYRDQSNCVYELALPGPVGEDNRLRILPRGVVLGIADTVFDALHQFGAALAIGSRFVALNTDAAQKLRFAMPDDLLPHLSFVDWEAAKFDAVLAAGQENARKSAQFVAARPGPIIPVISNTPEYNLQMLLKEKTVSVNTTAAGGNANLLTLAQR